MHKRHEAYLTQPDTPHAVLALLKNVFRLFKKVAEDVFIVLLILLLFEASELFKQMLLLRRQVRWGHHFDEHVLVATSAAMYDRHTHTLEPEGATALCSSWNANYRCLTIDCGYLDLVAEGCLSEADGQFVVNVVALPLEVGVRLHTQNDVQIPRCASTRIYFALARDAHVDTVIDAGRDIHHDAANIAHTA